MSTVTHSSPHLPVVRLRADRRRQVDAVAADLGCTAPLGSAVQPPGGRRRRLRRRLRGSQPGDVHQRHERHHGDVPREVSRFGEDLVLSPAQLRSQVGHPDVRGDQRGVVEDPAGAGHQITVARTSGFDGQLGEVGDAFGQG